MIPGKRISLWALEKGDLMQNYLWANDPELVQLTGINPIPRSAIDVERWYETSAINPNKRTFAIKLNDGAYIGNIEITNIDWQNRHGEIGVMVGNKSYRGKGYGKEAILTLCRFAFEEMGMHRLYADVISFNESARMLFLACGFQIEGGERESYYTWGKFWDVIRFSILDREFHHKFPFHPIEEEKVPKNTPSEGTEPAK